MDSRNKIIDDIHELTETEGKRRRQDKLAAKTLQKSSEMVTGEDQRLDQGRGKHLQTIRDQLETKVLKNLYSNDARLPHDALAELRTCLQQQQSSPLN